MVSEGVTVCNIVKRVWRNLLALPEANILSRMLSGLYTGETSKCLDSSPSCSLELSGKLLLGY